MQIFNLQIEALQRKKKKKLILVSLTFYDNCNIYNIILYINYTNLCSSIV